MSDEERTAIPSRVDVDEVRGLVKRRRDGGYDRTWLLNETIESMLIEVRAHRLYEARSKKRRGDSARAGRKALPPLTVENVDQYDQP